jgi:hypothetical protein
MAMPQFTDEERYLINYVRAEKTASNSYMFTYLVSGLVLAGFGAYTGSTTMMMSAFLVVCGFRVYEEMHGSKWTPVWRSIILKYEQAIRDVPRGATDTQNSN